MSAGLWTAVLDDLKSKIDQEAYESWFGPVEAEERKNTLILWVPTLFHKDWLDNHYKEGISSVASQHVGGKIRVKVQCRVDSIKQKKTKPSARTRAESAASDSACLNPLYTFDSFVVGTSNQFAHAACLAVAESPSKTYNPLFIYGGVGLGKTHLMHAIGHFHLRNNPDANILYVRAEQFTNEYINSLKESRIASFQKKFRSAEVLLIDDIQFLANKERSQEEFFHTFNELYESDHQLVIASDRPPREIPTIQDRLRSRLEWGLITDVKAPNLETRIAILRKKAEDANLEIPANCLEYIASKVRSNIRELEGALMRVGAMASFTNQPITLGQTQDALRDLMETHRDARITVDQIQKAVSEFFKVSTQDLKGKRRSSDVTLPRQVAMFLCREITGLSLPVIGTEFGGRDHTTVLHSCKKITNLLERDRHLQNILQDIKTML